MYEVTKGQALIYNGVMYPEGSIAPSGLEVEDLCAAGVLRLVEEKVVVRPEPVAQARSTAVSDFDSADASSVTNVPLRLLPNVLKDISDVSILLEMHESDSRKGGKDLIEERIGELEAANA
jgi:hypothetical protein